jgi:hypothetical protein
MSWVIFWRICSICFLTKISKVYFLFLFSIDLTKFGKACLWKGLIKAEGPCLGA